MLDHIVVSNNLVKQKIFGFNCQIDCGIKVKVKNKKNKNYYHKMSTN